MSRDSPTSSRARSSSFPPCRVNRWRTWSSGPPDTPAPRWNEARPTDHRRRHRPARRIAPAPAPPVRIVGAVQRPRDDPRRRRRRGRCHWRTRQARRTRARGHGPGRASPCPSGALLGGGPARTGPTLAARSPSLSGPWARKGTTPMRVVEPPGPGSPPDGYRDPASGGRMVELAHEALIDGWPRLRHWVDQARGWLLDARRCPRWPRTGNGTAVMTTGCCPAVASTRPRRPCTPTVAPNSTCTCHHVSSNWWRPHSRLATPGAGNVERDAGSRASGDWCRRHGPRWRRPTARLAAGDGRSPTTGGGAGDASPPGRRRAAPRRRGTTRTSPIRRRGGTPGGPPTRSDLPDGPDRRRRRARGRLRDSRRSDGPSNPGAPRGATRLPLCGLRPRGHRARHKCPRIPLACVADQ